jgi:hypothetical protein
MLGGLFGKMPDSEMIEKFKSVFISSGKMPLHYLDVLRDVIKAKKSMAKMSRQEVENIRKDSQVLIANLIEYSQRQKLAEIEQLRFSAKINDKEGEIYLIGKEVFIISDIKVPELKKIDLEKMTIAKADPSELEEALKQPKKETKLSKHIIEKIEKLIGKIELIF